MPICERDPWRFQYFEAVACPEHVRIPTDDIDSWNWYPQWRWIYDKVNIARSQGLACGTHDDVPAHYPVFSKPAINLKGMGLGSRVISSQDDFLRHRTAGHMWMTLLEGDHVSTDCAIVNGEVRWQRHAKGHTCPGGVFSQWTIEDGGRLNLSDYVGRWVEANMAGYTGMVNFETIGGRIIEAHLRFADQWCDLYGEGWLEALVQLYEKGCWHFAGRTPPTAYSLPLFAEHGLVPEHPPAELQARIRALPGISSLQITYYETKAGDEHPMPPGGFRLGIVNAWSLEAGLAARRLLATGFPGCALMLPE